MEGFSRAVRADLRGTGIRVTLVVAGKTASPYFLHNPGSEERIPTISNLMPTVTPDRVAAALVAAVEGDKSVAMIPAMVRGLYAAHRVSPRMVGWLMERTGWQRPGRGSAEGQ
jgi:short-subunit dehydrogenase